MRTWFKLIVIHIFYNVGFGQQVVPSTSKLKVLRLHIVRTEWILVQNCEGWERDAGYNLVTDTIDSARAEPTYVVHLPTGPLVFILLRYQTMLPSEDAW